MKNILKSRHITRQKSWTDRRSLVLYGTESSSASCLTHSADRFDDCYDQGQPKEVSMIFGQAKGV